MRSWWIFLLSWLAAAQTRESLDQQRKSVQLQRESVQKMAPLLHPSQPSCDAMPEKEVTPLIENAAKAQALPPNLLRAVVAQESGFRSCAVSDKGAEGLMQLMPATAEQLGVADTFDARANLEGGARFLRSLLEKYKGDLPHALGAYNAGPELVDKAGGIPDIPETRAYIDAIVEKVGTKQIDLPSIPMPRPIGN